MKDRDLIVLLARDFTRTGKRKTVKAAVKQSAEFIAKVDMALSEMAKKRKRPPPAKVAPRSDREGVLTNDPDQR
jgi:hypothetical protein